MQGKYAHRRVRTGARRERIGGMPASVFVSWVEYMEGVYLAVVAKAVRPRKDVSDDGVEEQVNVMIFDEGLVVHAEMEWPTCE